MTKSLCCAADFLKASREPLRRFFEGDIYPLAVMLITVIGHISGLEFYLNIPNMLMVTAALLVSPTFKVALPFMLTVVYQVNLKHSPGIPTWSDYYLSTHRIVIILILIALLASALIYFAVKNVIPRIDKKSVPLLLPLTILSAAFLMNGAFSDRWNIGNAVFGIAEVAVYFLLFYLLYYGLKGEDTDALLDRISYLSLLVGAVLVSEMVFMFLTYDGIFEGGSIVKESVNLGWGIWNPIGLCLTASIPMQMRGAMRSKRYPVYLLGSLLCWIFAVLTLSRNALIFSTLTVVACMIIACFASERKRLFRILTLTGAALAVTVTVLLWAKISSVLGDLLSRGASDNGRFELWRQGLENFISYPVFGRGFFGYGETDVFLAAEFIPTMAHNTAVQLLSSMGAFGALAYGFYRVKTLVPIFKRFSFEKLMLLITVLVPLLMSLLDNFVFYFYPVFFYLIALATVFLIRDGETAEENENKHNDSEKEEKN